MNTQRLVTPFGTQSTAAEVFKGIDLRGKCGIDLATAALQFSLRDPRVDATVVGITREPRIASLIASAGVDIPDAVWDELERLVPPAATWLDARDRP